MLSFLHSLTNEVPGISSTMKSKLPAVGFFTLLLCMLPLEGFTQWESIKGPMGEVYRILLKMIIMYLPGHRMDFSGPLMGKIGKRFQF